jgi:hypothetical protein
LQSNDRSTHRNCVTNDLSPSCSSMGDIADAPLG